ncbi:hypothetical protein HGRIS_006855 [Hohenbuehelia grisea]|uniref:Uncharacterized protein n=1 Tax=Hohenbuehelia grisea TaxID=104357 RepID=A0ABR3JBT3_9AGAR
MNPPFPPRPQGFPQYPPPVPVSQDAQAFVQPQGTQPIPGQGLQYATHYYQPQLHHPRPEDRLVAAHSMYQSATSTDPYTGLTRLVADSPAAFDPMAGHGLARRRLPMVAGVAFTSPQNQIYGYSQLNCMPPQYTRDAMNERLGLVPSSTYANIGSAGDLRQGVGCCAEFKVIGEFIHQSNMADPQTLHTLAMTIKKRLVKFFCFACQDWVKNLTAHYVGFEVVDHGARHLYRGGKIVSGLRANWQLNDAESHVSSVS